MPIEIHQSIPEFNDREKPYLKAALESDHLLFTRWQMRVREDTKMLIGQHHRLIADAMDAVFRGDINRLIINVPPGTTKTEMVSLAGVARGLALNPRSRTMMLSFSDDLVMDNSRKIRELIQSDEYQRLWDVRLKPDAKRRGLWITEDNGYLFAAPTKGQVTGFRAGTMDSGYTGMVILDDILKPEDAFSPRALKTAKRRITNTIKSRLMTERIPIVLIMQRIHMDDPCSFLLEGGTNENWHHLWLPLVLDDGIEYPKKWTHGIRIEHDLPNGILWDDKFKPEDIPVLKADKYTYSSQYAQLPEKSEDAIFEEDWFGRYHEFPQLDIVTVILYGDTAQKTGEEHDYTVFQAWGVCRDKTKAKFGGLPYLILMDLVRGKFNPDQLLEKAMAFWKRHKRSHGMNRVGARQFKIEDKSSGTGLMYQLKKKAVPIVPIKRDTQSKLSRFLDAVPLVSTGRVLLPEGEVIDVNGTILTDSKFVPTFITEICSIDLDMTQEYDDQADPFADAVKDNLIHERGTIYEGL